MLAPKIGNVHSNPRYPLKKTFDNAPRLSNCQLDMKDVDC